MENDKKKGLIVMWVLIAVIVALMFYPINALTDGLADVIINSTTIAGISIIGFLGLNDTPNSYSGKSGQCVTVNTSETGLNFTDCGNIGLSATEVSFIYGEMQNHSDTGNVIGLVNINQYKNITGFKAGNLSQVSFNDNALIPSQDGTYKVNWALAFGGGAGKEYQVTLTVNESLIEKCETHRVLGTGGDVGSTSGTCIIPLSIGDNVRLAVRTTSIPVTDVRIYIQDINILKLAVPSALSNVSHVTNRSIRINSTQVTGIEHVNNRSIKINQTQVLDLPVNRTVLIRWNNTDHALGTTSKTVIDAINLSQFNTTTWKGLHIYGNFYKIFSGKQLHNLQIWNCSGDPIETITIDTNPAGFGLDAQTIHPTIEYTVHSNDFCFDGLYHFRYQHISGTEGITKKYTSYEAII